MDQASAYRSGREAWPAVPLAEAEHAAAWAIDPGKPPLHPEDYFLAAAGGMHIDKAWEQVESSVGPRVRRCLSFQATADYFIEDLWSDTLLAVMAELPAEDVPIRLNPPRRCAKLLRYRARVKLVNYLVTIGKRLAISRQRKRKPITGLPTARRDDTDRAVAVELEDTRAAEPAQSAARSEAYVAFLGRLSAALDRLTTEQRYLITQVYLNAGKQKEVARQLGWTESKASRQLKSALAALQEVVQQTPAGDLDAAGLKQWAEAVRNMLDQPQEAPGGAS